VATNAKPYHLSLHITCFSLKPLSVLPRFALKETNSIQLIAGRTGQEFNHGKWTRSVAVCSESSVAATQHKLGSKGKGSDPPEGSRAEGIRPARYESTLAPMGIFLIGSGTTVESALPRRLSSVCRLKASWEAAPNV
jgi:hypothetical protein